MTTAVFAVFATLAVLAAIGQTQADGIEARLTLADTVGQPKLKKMIIADIETHVPLRGVVVFTDGYIDTTNYRGVCYIPETFDTLTVYRPSYLAERLLPAEVGDSAFLIPEGMGINEVTVWGTDGRKRINDAIEAAKRAEGRPLPDASHGTLLTFDIGKALDRRGRRDMRHLRKVRRKFGEADASTDPVVAAYEQTVNEQTWDYVGDSLVTVYQAKADSAARQEIMRRDSVTKAVAKEAEAAAKQ